MAEEPSTAEFCGYPVEKAAASLEMEAASNVLHAAQPERRPKAADTVRYHFNEEGADKIDDQSDEDLKVEHDRMVALFGSSVKAGKAGCDSLTWALAPNFPVLAARPFQGRLFTPWPKNPNKVSPSPMLKPTPI
jgi:hypothetical protein